MFKYLPFGLVSALLLRILILGASMGDAFGLIGLAALTGLHLYLENNKEPEVNEALKLRLAATEQEIKNLKDAFNSVKLGLSFKK